jgi:hypothetical protein
MDEHQRHAKTSTFTKPKIQSFLDAFNRGSGYLLFADWIKMVWFMVFNAAFNNISVISWRSVLLVEQTGVSGENHRPDASH